MNKESSQVTSENMSMKFSKGWDTILYQVLILLLLIGFFIDGLDIIAPAFVESTGIAYDQVLGVATWAGMIGTIAYILIARTNVSIGPRLLSGICLIGAGLSCIFLGYSATLTAYFITPTLVICFISGAAYIAGNTLIAQWFPKKKGLANGPTTMDYNYGSVSYVPLVSFTTGASGFASGMGYMTVGAIVLGIIGPVLVRNTSQECGMYPDNVTREICERECFQDNSEDSGG